MKKNELLVRVTVEKKTGPVSFMLIANQFDN